MGYVVAFIAGFILGPIVVLLWGMYMESKYPEPEEWARE
jgi:hypothetical protein